MTSNPQDADDTAYYFGYGSLVNRDTRPVGEQAWNARLSGWRRVWDHRVDMQDPRRACTSLSIQSARADVVIDGVLVALPRTDLAQLDSREHGYERLELPRKAFSFEQEPPADIDSIHVYRSLAPAQSRASHPILRSYVDCVMAGYLARFDWQGVEAFVSTTEGWGGVLLDDRTAPRYPRAVALAPELLEEFDRLLASVSGA